MLAETPEWKAMSKFSRELEVAAKARDDEHKWVVSPPIYDTERNVRVLIVSVAWRDGKHGHYMKLYEPQAIEPILAVLHRHWELSKEYFDE